MRNVNAKIWICVFIVKETVSRVLIMNVFHLERAKLNQLTLQKDAKRLRNVIINKFLLNKMALGICDYLN